jgi:hypothetical protein
MESHEHEIDAVGLVRRIRDDLYEETKDLSTEELIAFYRRRAAPAKAKLSRLHAEREEMASGRA